MGGVTVKESHTLLDNVQIPAKTLSSRGFLLDGIISLINYRQVFRISSLMIKHKLKSQGHGQYVGLNLSQFRECIKFG